MKKTFKSYLIIWAVLLAVFNVITFVVPEVGSSEKFTTSFWIGYAAVIITFAGQILCAKKAFNGENIQRLFYKISLVKLSYTGLIVSFIVGGLCILVPFIPYWVAAIACVIALAVTVIAVTKADIAVESVSAVDEKIKTQTFYIKSLTVDAENLMARAQTDEVKAECKKVYEAVRYSDPMSNVNLAAIENQISVKFGEFTAAVNKGESDQIKTLADEVVVLVNDRNKKCKLYK